MASGNEGEEARNGSALANRPFVVGLCYLSTWVTGIGAFVGVVLAYVFRSRSDGDWERSHYRYLINTFWLAFVPMGVAMALFFANASSGQLSGFAFVGFFFVIAIVLIHSTVRTVLSMMNAVSNKPMAHPSTWTV